MLYLQLATDVKDGSFTAKKMLPDELRYATNGKDSRKRTVCIAGKSELGE
jgi:hypothetical protein